MQLAAQGQSPHVSMQTTHVHAPSTQIHTKLGHTNANWHLDLAKRGWRERKQGWTIMRERKGERGSWLRRRNKGLGEGGS